MSYYIFKFRKADLLLELQSLDSAFVAKQMEFSYADIFKEDEQKSKKTSKKVPVPVEIPVVKEEKTVVESEKVVDAISKDVEVIIEKNKKEPKAKSVDEIVEEKSKVKAEVPEIIEEVVSNPALVEKVTEAVVEETVVSFKPKVASKVKEKEEVIVEAPVKVEKTEPEEIIIDFKKPEPVKSSKLQAHDVNSIVNAKKLAEAKSKILDSVVIEEEVFGVEEDFIESTEIIKDFSSSQKVEEKKNYSSNELNSPYSSPEQVQERLNRLVQEKRGESVLETENDFYKVLQKKFSTLPEIVSKKIVTPVVETDEIFSLDDVQSIQDLYNFKVPQSLLDYLIATSYYLKNYEAMDRYSLKQINAKVYPFTKEPINHAVIQEAVSMSLIDVVPDYTGMADVTEYIITEEGESYLLNEL